MMNKSGQGGIADTLTVRARKERNLPRVTYPLQCAMRPRVGIANLGPDVPSWQYLMY